MMGKVLLVDNSIPLSRSVEFTLTQNNYFVDSERDEEYAVKKLASEIYDVVIVDLKDVQEYGSKILQFLQNNNALFAPPVLGLTIPEADRSISGVTEWLTIPFSNDKLLSCMRNL